MNPALTALVVHDLKNALGHLEAGLAQLELDPSKDQARRAHQQCRELRQRFVMFLTLYGAHGQEMQAWRTDESPMDFLQGLARRVLAPEGAVPLAVADCPQAPPVWFFDPRLVGLALEAALHNAWRFARSHITLGARRDGEHLVLWIEDDGPGLGAEDPGAAHSTGLGTELCRAVARAHGQGALAGEVKLFNAPQGGARFELWLA